MTLLITRPSSPSHDHINSQDIDTLSTALHAALQPPSNPSPEEMAREKDNKPYIDIILASDCISLKGTGVDVEPALLSGHVALYLTESTSIKEINLSFRGKARMPTSTADSPLLNSSHHTYTVCTHDWSFLEGQRRHSHTLKAGRHLFPFQLQLGGSLPSTIYTDAYGGASVAYKLRAVAVRPGLSSNLQSVAPLSIIRSFALEALEYQQTLEIENTWPGKLMYSIMIPHKAWAIGDQLTAIVKFSPVAKGVRVLAVTTSITERTKLYGRRLTQDHTRTVATSKHEFMNGKAALVVEQHHRMRVSLLHGSNGSHTYTYSSSTPPTPPGLSEGHRTSSSGSLSGLATLDASLTRTRPQSTSSDDDGLGALSTSSIPSSSIIPSLSVTDHVDDPESNEDIDTTISISIPPSATPTHAPEPITVSHRVRWSILISNLVGHTSELRCSLPLHVLDHRLLPEALANTAATRRIMLGTAGCTEGDPNDTELPSYPAHIRDRVANMYLPDASTLRVANPWVQSGVSPTHLAEPQSPFSPTSGASSPLQANPLSSHLPHAPPSGANTPLDWVNSELLLSLWNQAATRPEPTGPSSPDHFYPTSQPSSAPHSQRPSRRQSRAASPEHNSSGPHGPPPVGQTFTHGDSQASRNLPGVFKNAMKPLTSLHPHSWLSSSRPSSYTNLSSLASTADTNRSIYRRSLPHTPPTADQSTMSTSETELLHRAFTEVPDYGVASRGFIGGVPPLSSMRGLPSYEEASHPLSRSASDLSLSSRQMLQPFTPSRSPAY